MTRPGMPMPRQNAGPDPPAPDDRPRHTAAHDTPAAISGPTTNWPADPPAIPNIWVAPISVAARDAGKLVVAMKAAPTSAKPPPAPAKNRPMLARPLSPVANSNAPTPTVAAPIGTTFRGPIRSIAAPTT